jgi:hypothetical protein
MKAKKLFNMMIVSSLMLVSLSAQSESFLSTAKTNLNSVLSKLKKANLSSSLVIDSSTNGQLSGTNTLLIPSLNYSIDKKNSLNLRLYNSISTDESFQNPETTLQTLQMRFTRSGLLTESTNGLNLSLQLRASMPAKTPLRVAQNIDSSYDGILTASKSLNKKITLVGIARTTLYNFRDSSKDGKTLRNMAFLIPSIKLNKKYSLDLTNYLINSIYTNKVNSNLLIIEPTLSTSLMKNLGLSVYASLLYGNDSASKFLQDDILANGTYGLSLSTKLF